MAKVDLMKNNSLKDYTDAVLLMIHGIQNDFNLYSINDFGDLIREYHYHTSKVIKANNNLVKEYVKSLVKSIMDEFINSLVNCNPNTSEFSALSNYELLDISAQSFDKFEESLVSMWSSMISLKDFTILFYDSYGTELKGKPTAITHC